jgi:hypothetical protein
MRADVPYSGLLKQPKSFGLLNRVSRCDKFEGVSYCMREPHPKWRVVALTMRFKLSCPTYPASAQCPRLKSP